MSSQPNVDPAEVQKFDAIAASWWDPEGAFRPLHDLNPTRAAFVEQHCPVAGKAVLDVGCGGGLLSEALAALGGEVTGIDMASEALSVARLHRHESGLEVDYRQITSEDLAVECPDQFDVVTCMELLEHVPDPASMIKAMATLLKPGGFLFASTLNRTAKAFALAVVGAEYVLGLLPRGTHEYARFIKPSELTSLQYASPKQ